MVEDYTFFKDCYYYISDEQFALTDDLSIFYSDNCSKLPDWEEYHTAICIKFKKVIKYINSKFITGEFYHDTTYKPYMNFWLNYQLGQHNNNKFTAKNFYDIMKERDPGFFAIYFNNDAHDISENDLNDMKKLYGLYKLYYDIWVMNYSITDGCINKAKECFSLYKNLIQTCAPGVKKNFCEALLKFRDAYNTLKSETECLNKELSELPSYDQVISLSQKLTKDSEHKQEQVQPEGREIISSVSTELSSENNNILKTVVSTLGASAVFFSAYMFTPLGSWVRRKIQRKKANVGDLKEQSHKLLDISERQYQNYDKMKYGISYESFADS
ncbi:VIR protein [Plasmodium vivax]|uniref:VIR protein n=1 Tax=Plasmodium vivax TaxID=5855 RepID=A0A1G4E8F2_PLAVI|nr:VIR protein [Plasmodium vivax]